MMTFDHTGGSKSSREDGSDAEDEKGEFTSISFSKHWANTQNMINCLLFMLGD